VHNSYKPSMHIVAAKSILALLEKAFPKQIYKVFYDAAFSSYRVIIRFLYLRFWLSAVITGNSSARRKVNTVFRVMPYSLVGWRGLHATYDAVMDVQERWISGDIVECGVARGGSAALMSLLEALAGNHRKIWLFDSYEGLPEPTKDDFRAGISGRHVRPLPKGACLGTFGQVEDLLFRRLRLDRNSITMVKGWFQDTLPAMRSKIDHIAVLRIDADWYESVKCCLENMYDQVVLGGIIIIDDYASCFGAQAALDEFLAIQKIGAVLLPDGRGGCIFRKPFV